ncbi:CpaD family pilus assembly lipoprotein [Pelagibius sp.]|uniref:CpaD family pilus assembly lipoprotein n=1 Tax=Pelagibius sp. TaxID=1931238 RepID=UPI002635B86A|nr:CpaD family pilus assembly lipoprotein [Pelagibius sp.]
MTGRKQIRLTTALALCLLATGCAGDPDRSPDAQAVADAINVVFHHAKWQQIPASPANQADAILFQQSVFFIGSSALLDEDAQQAIDALLWEAEPDPGTVVSLSAGSGDAPRYDRLTLQRLEAVRVALADRGYEAVLGDAPAVPAPGSQSNEVRMSLTKFMPILPDCDQPQPLEPDRPAFDTAFGCSNAHNLGVMVANPGDLERGRTLEPADGEFAAGSVRRYRLGEIEPLKAEDSKSQ